MPAAQILVVCTANVARSPLAEVLLQGHARQCCVADQVSITSAGVRAREGFPAAESSVRIAEEWGLDLSGHTSRPVAPTSVEASDLVLTMSERQRDRLCSQTKGAHDRCFTLREFARLVDGVEPVASVGVVASRVRQVVRVAHRRRPVSRPAPGGEDIADPFGGPHEGFVTMANELVALHERIVPTLFGPTASEPPPRPEPCGT